MKSVYYACHDRMEIKPSHTSVPLNMQILWQSFLISQACIPGQRGFGRISTSSRFLLHIVGTYSQIYSFTVIWFGCPSSAGGGVTKRCRLSWLTNSAFVGIWAQMRGLSQRIQLCTWSPNKLRISNSIFYLYSSVLQVSCWLSDQQSLLRSY